MVLRDTAGQLLLYSGHGHLATSALLLQHEASANGHLNTAEVLFQRGADINKQNKVKSLGGGTCIRE